MGEGEFFDWVVGDEDVYLYVEFYYGFVDFFLKFDRVFFYFVVFLSCEVLIGCKFELINWVVFG